MAAVEGLKTKKLRKKFWKQANAASEVLHKQYDKLTDASTFSNLPDQHISIQQLKLAKDAVEQYLRTLEK